MTVYYSERVFTNEIIAPLRKEFPRGDLDSNYLELSRAGAINYVLFHKYFECAVAKEHNLYKVAITLPIDLKNRISAWSVQSNGEIWVDPKSGPEGFNIRREEVFTVKFNFYVDEDDIRSYQETQNISVEKALIGEFTEIRHALIEGNEEPIDIFKGFYVNQEVKNPKTHTGKYLLSILAVPH
ncbi:MAG: hypothetical protein MZV64_26860 [Ignavibacteriales bacterium]|nr:hypothetical protein [Ignavibacteriales bacterium]